MSSHDFPAAEALLRSHLQAADRPAAAEAPARPAYVITISREAGALGSRVADEVGRRLGWPVYDRNLLEQIAEKLRRPSHHLEGVDERKVSWLEEGLAGLLDRAHVGPDAYFHYLLACVRGLGAKGHCVIVGRGANFMLPAESTLRVRLVARPEDRARVVAERLKLSAVEAAAWVEKTDRQRLAFLRDHFPVDPADSHHYDLVLNLSRLSAEDAADLIADTLRRFERRGAPAAPAVASGGV